MPSWSSITTDNEDKVREPAKINSFLNTKFKGESLFMRRSLKASYDEVDSEDNSIDSLMQQSQFREYLFAKIMSSE